MPLRYDPATGRMIPDYGSGQMPVRPIMPDVPDPLRGYVPPGGLRPVPGAPVGSPNMPGNIAGGIVGPGVGSFTKPNVLGAPAVPDRGFVPLPAPYTPPRVEEQPRGPIGGPSYVPPMRGPEGGYGGPPIPPSPEFGGLSPVGGGSPWIASGQLPGGIPPPRSDPLAPPPPGGLQPPSFPKYDPSRQWNGYGRPPWGGLGGGRRRLQDVFPKGFERLRPAPRPTMWGDDGRRY